MVRKVRMARLNVILLALVFAAFPTAVRAQDGVLEWLDRLSGPGIFRPTKQPAYEIRLICKSSSGDVYWLWQEHAGDSLRPRPCLIMSPDPIVVRYYLSVSIFGKSETDNEMQFGEPVARTISARRFQMFLRWHPHRAFDAGFGGGATNFYGNRPNGGTFSFFSGEFIPVSLILRPVAIWTKNSWARVFVIRNDQAFRFGTITSGDFGSPTLPDKPGYFSTGNEWNVRAGIVIDGLAVVDAIRNKGK
jgi:hypothetical protein